MSSNAVSSHRIFSDWPPAMQRTQLHLAAELLLGNDSVIHPSDCLSGHNETPPGWRAAINEHRRGRRAPEITHSVSCPLGKPDVCMYIILGVFWDIKDRHRRVELAQQSNTALCSWQCVPETTGWEHSRNTSTCLIYQITLCRAYCTTTELPFKNKWSLSNNKPRCRFSNKSSQAVQIGSRLQED